ISLVTGVALTSLAFVVYQTIMETRGVREEAQRHAVILAESLEKPVATLLARNSVADLQTITDLFPRNTGVVGIAVYDSSGSPLAVTSRFSLPATPRPVHDAITDGVTHSE